MKLIVFLEGYIKWSLTASVAATTERDKFEKLLAA